MYIDVTLRAVISHCNNTALSYFAAYVSTFIVEWHTLQQQSTICRLETLVLLCCQSLSKMFGALNRFISRLDSESPSQSSRHGHPSYGFQVLRNKNQEIAIDPWYDFIIGINGRQIVRRI